MYVSMYVCIYMRKKEYNNYMYVGLQAYHTGASKLGVSLAWTFQPHDDLHHRGFSCMYVCMYVCMYMYVCKYMYKLHEIFASIRINGSILCM